MMEMVDGWRVGRVNRCQLQGMHLLAVSEKSTILRCFHLDASVVSDDATRALTRRMTAGG